MKQKGFILPIILLGITTIILIFLGGYLTIKKQDNINYVNVIKPIEPPSPSPTQIKGKLIHPYNYFGVDTKASLNQIHIIGVLFKPKDIATQIKPEWPRNMESIFKEIKDFYEKQFEGNISITYEVVPEPYTGVKDLEQYNPQELAVELNNNKKDLLRNGVYNIFMIYLVRDEELKKNVIGGNLGGLAPYHAASQYEFWLDDEALNSNNPYGIVGSAHEFGHALGIPHSWELPINVNHDPNFGNTPGDLMGYNNNGLQLKNLYIREDVKKEMGL